MVLGHAGAREQRGDTLHQRGEPVGVGRLDELHAELVRAAARRRPRAVVDHPTLAVRDRSAATARP